MVEETPKKRLVVEMSMWPIVTDEPVGNCYDQEATETTLGVLRVV